MRKPYCTILLVLLFGTGGVLAQEVQQDSMTKIDRMVKAKVKRHTLMECYEPDMVISAEERKQLKKKRILSYYETRNMLDTIDIPDRKRKKLLYDLKWNPRSERLTRFVAENQFSDDNL
ncbi:MAG: hypothetical protein AB3N16_11130 [Flavobacteriaceae bacterium]